MRTILTFLCLLLMVNIQFGQTFQAEQLQRGLITIPQSDHNFLSWRMFPQDSSDNVTYRLLRDGAVITPTPLSGLTHYVDPAGSSDSEYVLQVLASGVVSETSDPVRPWAESYLEIPTRTPEGYTLNDASIGDLTGDGQFEIIVKMEKTAKDNSHAGYTDPVLLHAYTLTGTFLWSIDLGINIRAGAHYTQFMVFDLDGDGKAELACKTAPGTKDGRGHYLASGPAASDDDQADYRTDRGTILSGPEYLTVFSGTDGAELHTVYYTPRRHPDTENPTPAQQKATWGDDYGNRSDRFLAGVAYFDESPSLVMCRGYYTRTVLAAWDFRDGKLSQRWVFDSEPDWPDYGGQGAHSLSVGDVDGDGRDEIMYGAMAIDDDGSPLYSTRFQHGDATHLGDLLPGRAGLEFFMPHESAGKTHDGITNPGLHVRDAGTGEIIWTIDATGDIGRGLTANISDAYPGNEFWASHGLGVFDSQGRKISDNRPPINFAIWWDGDLVREILDHTEISKWYPDRTVSLLSVEDCRSNNGTKGTPALSGDLFGDWREEVIWRSKDNQSLRIYSTTIPTEFGLPSLSFDRQYRLALTWQNTAYNQPPHPSFFLGKK
ncbi:rhamnogalacturonan lyase [Flavilitoribacter nigricans]|uniref:Uncharacterized protein n=1 Tax=Flavilitoribacter nigricans (strain ATCC 23147 / DSM 23189 / NBRC 102662 / NCIMB 1420 / SS-2) TaxID=1122177 RepID=A0A2D0MWT7_FLAN2|nr:rhamnogalacturonan lyase [Flavilitoribacter nigricans]PHN00741.1 hypothetical protein CRP01_40710 [Flavilitoribacter nigricans DSM 23189 = NBRC 102662]